MNHPMRFLSASPGAGEIRVLKVLPWVPPYQCPNEHRKAEFRPDLALGGELGTKRWLDHKRTMSNKASSGLLSSIKMNHSCWKGGEDWTASSVTPNSMWVKTGPLSTPKASGNACSSTNTRPNHGGMGRVTWAVLWQGLLLAGQGGNSQSTAAWIASTPVSHPSHFHQEWVLTCQGLFTQQECHRGGISL